MKLLIFLLFTLNSFGLTITDEKAIELGKQWYPQELGEYCLDWADGKTAIEEPNFGWSLHDETGPYHFPLIFNIPNDPNDYILLAWSDCISYLFWRILKTNDGGKTFQFVCDIDKIVSDSGYWWSLRLVDLTGDNIPELLQEGAVHGVSSRGDEGIAIWQWRDGCFKHITPYDWTGEYSDDKIDNNYKIVTNSFLELDDIDEDGKAEIIIGPTMSMNWGKSETGEDDVTWTVSYPGEVWRYNGSMYEKWYELDPNDENPIYVPSLGVFHPSTIPFSELSNPGQGKISIFISDPPGSLTCDDFVKNLFTLNEISISFKKIWNNKNNPDEKKANYEFLGCPVKQVVRKSQGDFQTNPQDPFILSQDLKMEYHFLGKYIELEARRDKIYPILKSKAEKFFEENPQSELYWASLPIKGRFNNGKISQISTFISIKRTGNLTESKEREKK